MLGLQAKIFLFVLILVMGLAFPFSLIFEVPFVNLDKIYLSPLSIKKHRLEQPVSGDGVGRKEQDSRNGRMPNDKAAQA